MAISFNGTTKIISLSIGTTNLSVRELWSRWNDWLEVSDNSKYSVAMSFTGAEDIDLIEGTKIPVYLFLLNGWKIKPQESNHTLVVSDGILLVFGGGDPFINTNGAYTVRLRYSQPVQAISFSTGASSSINPTAEEIAIAVRQAIIAEISLIPALV